MKKIIIIALFCILNVKAQDTVFVSGNPRNITIIFTGQDTVEIPQDTIEIPQDTIPEPQDTIADNQTDTNHYKIMCIGDSNTEGYGFAGSYRFMLDSLLGQNWDFIGRKSNGSFTDNQHEGYSGIDINAIKYDHILFGNMLTNKNPNFIVLLLGTNDVNDVNGNSPNNDPIAEAPERYRDLILDIQQRDSNAIIICVSLLPIYSNQWGNGNLTKVNTFNSKTSTYIMNNSKAGTKLFWLDVTSNFNSGDFIDGLHLKQSAYNRLGGYIYSAITNIQ